MPKTRYTRAGGVRIAYQVFGEGAADILYVPGIISHVELQWADPAYTRFLDQLGGFGRVIMYDKRGTGASERVPRAPTLAERVEEALAVLDAADSRRALVFGFSDGGATGAMLAAHHPGRVLGLILWAAYLRQATPPEELGIPQEVYDHYYGLAVRTIETWGEGNGLDFVAPSLAGSSYVRQAYGLFERAAADAGYMRTMLDSREDLDVTSVLPLIQVPTLVLHRREEITPPSVSRDVVARIPGARMIEFDGGDHVPYAGDAVGVVDAMGDFLRELTGRSLDPPEYSTVLFTDIVDSTRRIVEVGDVRWHDTIAVHDEVARREIERHGGRFVDSTGDGILASFDSPLHALQCACALRAQIERLGLAIRGGLHAGECHRSGDRLRGLAVHAAARVMAEAGSGEILISRTVADLLRPYGVETAPRASKPLKGLPGTWELARVEREPAPLPPDVSRVSAGEQPPLRRSDRLQVGFARRVPGVVRAIARLAS